MFLQRKHGEICQQYVSSMLVCCQSKHLRLIVANFTDGIAFEIERNPSEFRGSFSNIMKRSLVRPLRHIDFVVIIPA